MKKQTKGAYRKVIRVNQDVYESLNELQEIYKKKTGFHIHKTAIVEGLITTNLEEIKKLKSK